MKRFKNHRTKTEKLDSKLVELRYVYVLALTLNQVL